MTNQFVTDSIERIRVADARHAKSLKAFADNPFSFFDFILNESQTQISDFYEPDGRSGGTNFENDSSVGGSGEGDRVARSSPDVERGSEPR
jgi:hypothetical protein